MRGYLKKFMKEKAKKIIYINLDGFSYSYYQYLHHHKLDDGFEKLKEEGIFFQNLHSGLISITNPMQSAILSGTWSNKTHNFYQHFDKEERKVVKHLRTFDAQNVAELFLESGKTVVSIHQFMLENNPCVKGSKRNNYFVAPNEHSNYLDRFSILYKIIKKEPVYIGEKEFIYDEFPDLLALYIDDLDSLGHNNSNYQQYPKRKTFRERQKDIQERLLAIQNELMIVKKICVEQNIYDDVIILVTTDHGMTPYYGKSSLSLLKETLEKCNLKVSFPDDVKEDTDLVLIPISNECSFYFLKPITLGFMKEIREKVLKEDYIDKVLLKQEMMKKYGLDERGPEILVSAKKGNHFSIKDYLENYGANHDSLDKTSQHIFGMVFGGEIQPRIITKRVTSIDLIPSIIKNNNDLVLKDATNKINFWDL